jgi:hypothetical protein
MDTMTVPTGWDSAEYVCPAVCRCAFVCACIYCPVERVNSADVRAGR